MKKTLSAASPLDVDKQAQTRLIKFIIAAGTVLFLLSGSAWLYLMANNSDAIFWGAINNSAQAKSFVRSYEQNDGFQSVKQVSVTQTSPQILVNGRNTIEQSGEDGATVVTKLIGTPYADYASYEKLATAPSEEGGNSPDFSSVIGVWGESSNPDSNLTTGQQVNQALFGLIPFGYLSPENRAEYLKLVKDSNVYQIVEVNSYGGFLRKTYEYKVTVYPVPYVQALKTFSHMIGMNQFEDISPSDYESLQPITATIKIDNLSRDITEIAYADDVRTESVSGIGIKTPLEGAPEETISMQQLQYNLQTIQ